MCGVFGFIAEKGRRFDRRSLQAVARATVARGEHAFGFAWVDPRGRIQSYRQAGKISDHLALLGLARDAVMLIGHTRYATNGDPDQNINNHPHPSDGGWIVHNGIVRNYLELLLRHPFHMSSWCDSEVLARLIEVGEGSLLARCRWAIREASRDPLALLGLWAWPSATMVVARRGYPLHISTTNDGIYLASLAEGMPGKPQPLKDGTIRRIWTGKKGVIHGQVCAIEGTADQEPDRQTHGNAVR